MGSDYITNLLRIYAATNARLSQCNQPGVNFYCQNLSHVITYFSYMTWGVTYPLRELYDLRQ